MQYFADNLTRDGYNDSWPKAKVAKDFSGCYALFKGTPAVFDLEILGKNGQIQTIQVDGLTTPEIIKNNKKRYPNRPAKVGNPLQFKIEKNIGILTIQSFDLPTIKKVKQQYKAFFKTTFQQIKQKKLAHLIIDLRDNGGGWPEVVDELFSYLIDQPYTNQTEAFTITKNLPNLKHYKHGLWELLDIRKSLKLKKEGAIYRVTDGEKNTTIVPAKNRFSGKIYVLANPFTFSAATSFMGMLKATNRGTSIGETAGGNPHQVTAWIMPVLVLPHSKIEAIIPIVCMKTKHPFPNDGLGIIPDYFVKPTIEEVLQNKDAVMKTTLNIIHKKEKTDGKK